MEKQGVFRSSTYPNGIKIVTSNPIWSLYLITISAEQNWYLGCTTNVNNTITLSEGQHINLVLILIMV